MKRKSFYLRCISIILIITVVFCGFPMNILALEVTESIQNAKAESAVIETEIAYENNVGFASKSVQTSEVFSSGEFSYTILNGSYISITGYSGNSSSVIIPSTIDSYVVQTIAANAFKNNTNISSVSFPSTLESIGSSAFYGCTGLINISLQSGLTTIKSYAFSGCTGLASLELPDTVTTIGERAFQNCTNLSSINYPSSLKEAGTPINYVGKIFYGCSKLTSITVPEGVTTLPEYVFEGCNYFTSIHLPSTLTSIGRSAFSGCTNLTGIELPNGLTTINSYAFSGCSNLEYVLIPASVKTIAKSVFKDADKLTLHCALNSFATIYAVDNKIPFIATDNGTDDPDTVMNRRTSRYIADFDAVNTNGYISFAVDCNSAASSYAELQNPCAKIKIPANVELVEDSLWINEALCTNYTYVDGYLTIPLSAQNNAIRFSAKVTSVGDIYGYALLTCKQGNVSKTEVIGIVISSSADVLTLDCIDITSTSDVCVSGVAPKGAAVSIAVDGAEQTILSANKAGLYTGTISLNGTDGNVYAISASCLDTTGNSLSATKQTAWQKDAPVLTGFDFYVNGSRTPIDLYASAQNGIRPSATFTGSASPYKFEVTFTNPERIAAVYITSTRNNVKRSMPAVYNEKTGTYIAEGFFGNERRYVPGTFGIEYTLNYEMPLVGESIDWTSYRGYLSQELLSSTIVTAEEQNEDSMHGRIDFSNLGNDLSKAALDYSIKSFDDKNGTSIKKWIGLSKTETNVFSYIVPGLDDSRYYVFLDFRDPDTYMMLVSDGLDVASKLTEFRLDMVNVGDPTFTSLFDLSNKLSHYSITLDVVQKVFGFAVDNHRLRKEIMQSEYITDTAAALEKADELCNDQIGFTLLVTILPLLVAGGSMTGPTLLLSSMLGVMASMSGYFWEYRTNQILGGTFKISWKIDPSGYVFDTETEERLEGVTVTAYCIEYDENNTDFWTVPPSDTEYGTVWNALEYSQLNPLTTDIDGRYAWDVPEGWWRVKYEKDGYVTVWSDWMTVPPIQTDVNIGMMPTVLADYSLKATSTSATETTVVLSNNSEKTIDVLYMLAAYNEVGKMVACNANKCKLVSYQNTALTVIYPSDANVTCIKAIILDLDQHLPLRDVWVKKIVMDR